MERAFTWSQGKLAPLAAKRSPSFYKLCCMKAPRWLQNPPRKLFCAAYIAVTVAILVGFTVTTLPAVVKEGTTHRAALVFLCPPPLCIVFTF